MSLAGWIIAARNKSIQTHARSRRERARVEVAVTSIGRRAIDYNRPVRPITLARGKLKNFARMNVADKHPTRSLRDYDERLQDKRCCGFIRTRVRGVEEAINKRYPR